MGWDWLYNPVAPIRDIGKAITGGNDSGGDKAPTPAPLPGAHALSSS